MPFLSHFCKGFTDFPISCPNGLGVDVVSLNTIYHVGIRLSTLFISSLFVLRDDRKLKKKYIVDEKTYLTFVRSHEKGTAYIYLANRL
jgi:hypothetical protein